MPLGSAIPNETVPEALNIYRKMISRNALSAIGTKYFYYKI
jgi:hypothetical protein